MDGNQVKFETQIKELEAIINDLENGNIGLEESIEKYTKAMQLVKQCDQKLNEIEEKVTKLVTESGMEDFTEKDENSEIS